MKLRLAVCLWCTVCAMQAQDQPAKPKADVIFVHGNVYTGVAVMSAFKAIRGKETTPPRKRA